MRLILNPKYKHLREYIEHIDEHFEHEGHEIHRDRNVIRTLQVDGLTLCVKRYSKNSLTDRVAIKLRVRSSRARKAYIRPLLLKERGFDSPEPVAFVRYNTGFINSVSYFICLKSKFEHSMADIMSLSPEKRDEVTEAFARFAAHLHKNGFLHRDFSSDNILLGRVEDNFGSRIKFSLIDTNSMSCGRGVSVKKGCSNFARLEGDDAFFTRLAECYADARQANRDECLRYIFDARDDYRRRKGRS
ncbi:MAG: lipopolysaccharide kinase InaA family protein [Bacteroidales bacterium]|nr:lipopolysaccharide kinase InaA family protein [Bacteroidales bacterium]